MLRHALTLFQAIPGSEEKRAHCLSNLAATLNALGKPAQAESVCYQALTLYRAIPDSETNQAICMSNLATILDALANQHKPNPSTDKRSPSSRRPQKLNATRLNACTTSPSA